jgi:hypothetical protein
MNDTVSYSAWHRKSPRQPWRRVCTAATAAPATANIGHHLP